MAKTDNELELEENPSAVNEANDDFSTKDEKSDLRNKNHEIDLLKVKMGPLGRLIGSTDSSKTIAFVTVILCLLVILFVFFGSTYDQETNALSDSVSNIISILASIVTGCIGFIFGKKHN